MITPEFITALGAMLVGVIGAFAAILTKRGQNTAEELKQLRVEAKALRLQRQLATGYFGKLIRLLAFHDIPIPKPPEDLFDDLPYASADNQTNRDSGSPEPPELD